MGAPLTPLQAWIGTQVTLDQDAQLQAINVASEVAGLQSSQFNPMPPSPGETLAALAQIRDQASSIRGIWGEQAATLATQAQHSFSQLANPVDSPSSLTPTAAAGLLQPLSNSLTTGARDLTHLAYHDFYHEQVEPQVAAVQAAQNQAKYDSLRGLLDSITTHATQNPTQTLPSPISASGSPPQWLNVPAKPLVEPWDSPDPASIEQVLGQPLRRPTPEQIVSYAEGCRGIPYAEIPSADSKAFGKLDCSGLVFACFAAFGFHLPRTSQEQWACPAGRFVPWSERRPGDVVTLNPSPGDPHGHTGIYVGKLNGVDTMVVASSGAGKVIYQEIDNGYWLANGRFAGLKRYTAD
jgi:cell wall-associated NlpC family hydrolase